MLKGRSQLIEDEIIPDAKSQKRMRVLDKPEHEPQTRIKPERRENQPTSTLNGQCDLPNEKYA